LDAGRVCTVCRYDHVLMLDTTFTYDVVAASLKDEADQTVLLQMLVRFLDTAGGARGEPSAERPVLYLVLTGGTERQVLDRIARRRALVGEEPVFLVAHRSLNSLPACLEILARVRSDGGGGEIVLLDDGEGAVDRLRRVVRIACVQNALGRSRIGVIGPPSDWLVASDHPGKTVRAAWGPELVEIPLADLRGRMGRAQGDVAGAAATVAEARSCVEPKAGDLARATVVSGALRELVAERGLDAFTIRCFDLVVEDRLTACLALSLLADEGTPAGCEGDIPSVLALLWVRLLLEQAGWMANPAWIDPEAGELMLAHCTVPRSLGSAFDLRSHFESGLGVAIQAELRRGPVTLVRIGGSGLQELWSAEGELVDSPREEHHCRTQALVRVDPARLRELLTAPLGNHLVLVCGHHGSVLRDSRRLAG